MRAKCLDHEQRARARRHCPGGGEGRGYRSRLGLPQAVLLYTGIVYETVDTSFGKTQLKHPCGCSFYKRSTTRPPTYGKQAKSSPYNEWLTIITEIIGTQTPPLTTGSGIRSILQAKHARTTKCRQWDAQHLASEPLSIRRISGCKLPPPPALELAPRPSR